MKICEDLGGWVPSRKWQLKIWAEWPDKPVKICEDLWKSEKKLWVKIVSKSCGLKIFEIVEIREDSEGLVRNCNLS